MTAKTNFSSEEFIQILADYNIGDYVSSQPFARGADQTNIWLITTKGRFAFRYYEKRSIDYVQFEIELLSFLEEHDYPSPGPIANKEGKYTEIYKEKPFAIFEFLEGEHDENKKNVAQVAEVISYLHVLTKDYAPKHNVARESEDPDYAWRCAQESVKLLPGVVAKERLSWVKDHLSQLQIPDSLPRGVCHGDTNPGNFLYKNGKLSAVLDFDQANYTILLLDIASMLMWYAWNNDFDYSTAKIIVGSYERKRELLDIEKRHMFDVLVLVNLIGTSWFLHDDKEYRDGQQVTRWLSQVGRDAFYTKLFGESK